MNIADLFKNATPEGDDVRLEELDGETFLAEVVFAMSKVTKNGNPMLSLKFRILEEGKHRGDTTWDNLVFTESSANRVFGKLMRLGIGAKWWDSHTSLDDALAEAVTGKQVVVSVTTRGEYTNTSYAEVENKQTVVKRPDPESETLESDDIPF